MFPTLVPTVYGVDYQVSNCCSHAFASASGMPGTAFATVVPPILRIPPLT